RDKKTLKEENRLLKEETALTNTKKMHYECEISRLNKVEIVLVQIYEEDFKRERSDRERLNEEKETLQRMNERSQLQLNELNSQIKDCQEEKKLLEKQVKKQVSVPRTMCRRFLFVGGKSCRSN
ncbi:hypothetical protein lerEdw1_012302, partial [Lerista edwardsae]